MASLVVKMELAIAAVICMAQVCHAGESAHVLKTNPFARPVAGQQRLDAEELAEQTASVPFVLRGTMLAGQQSLANISGVIVSLGEEIDGYKLVAIQQREVVLLKNGERRILSVDAEKEGAQR